MWNLDRRYSENNHYNAPVFLKNIDFNFDAYIKYLHYRLYAGPSGRAV